MNGLGLCDFDYLGLAYVSLLEGLSSLLRRSLSLMEIWDGCMHL